MSVFNDLLSNTQTTIQSLAFTWGVSLQPVQTIVASQPLNLETLSPALPIIYVAPAERPETVEQGATGGYVDVNYRVEVSVFAPGNASFETNLPTYLSWRESLRKALQRVFYSSISGLWGVFVTPRDVLNRNLQKDNYDFSILEIEYKVLEKATV